MIGQVIVDWAWLMFSIRLSVVLHVIGMGNNVGIKVTAAAESRGLTDEPTVSNEHTAAR